MKKFLKVSIAFTLVFTTYFPGIISPISHVKAADQTTTYSTKLKVLEVYDVYNAANILKSTDVYDVTPISMKAFNSDRTNLDGKYDAIYLAQGTYSTDFPNIRTNTFVNGVSGVNTLKSSWDGVAATKTDAIMNDITPLKKQQIIDYYINKGLPVIFDSSVENQIANTNRIPSEQRVLYDFYQSVKSNNSVRVLQFSNVASYLNAYTPVRPQILQITSNDSNVTYKPGDQFSLKFKLKNTNFNNYRAALYFDQNYDINFQSDEKVYENQLSAIQKGDYFEIDYNLPYGYTGMRYWKLEVIDQISQLKTYVTGSFTFTDYAPVINILQVTANGEGKLKDRLDASSLGTTISTNGDSISTKLSNGVVMNIDTVTMSDFNTCPSGKPCYQKINNGTYNMLIFGFKDEYGTGASPSTSATVEIQKFINSGQSVFLTHDTFYRSMSGSNLNAASSWFKTLFNYGGQNIPINVSGAGGDPLTTPQSYYLEHNLGLQGKVITSSATQINQGIITDYPFKLGKTIQVAKTHLQYYGLNLNDPTVIPWYNLSLGATYGANSDDDSYNKYYIYSKNNLTYTGAGHTNTAFAATEQQLFVNTMYRAFQGANHAPIIDLYTPVNDYYMGQKMSTSFKLTDYDYRDKQLNYTVDLMKKDSNGNYIKVETKSGIASNGVIQTVNFDTVYSNSTAALKVVITAADQLKAQTVKEALFNVKAYNTTFKVNREFVLPSAPDSVQFANTPYIQTGKTASIKYSVMAQPIPYKDIQDSTTPVNSWPIRMDEGNNKIGAAVSIDRLDLEQNGLNKNGFRYISLDAIDSTVLATKDVSLNQLNASGIVGSPLDLKSDESKPFFYGNALKINQRIIVPVFNPTTNAYTTFSEIKITDIEDQNKYKGIITNTNYFAGLGSPITKDISISEDISKACGTDVVISSVSSDSSQFIVNNTTNQGFSMSGTVTYTRDDANQQFVASPINVTANIVSNVSAIVLLPNDDSKLMFTDSVGTNTNIYFPAIGPLVYAKPLESIKLDKSSFATDVGEVGRQTVNLSIAPSDYNTSLFKFSTPIVSDSDKLSVSQVGNNSLQYSIVANKECENQSVTFTVSDIFGNQKLATVQVSAYNSVPEFSFKEAKDLVSIYVDETKPLTLIGSDGLPFTSAQMSNVTISLVNNNGNVSLDASSNPLKLSGLKVTDDTNQPYIQVQGYVKTAPGVYVKRTIKLTIQVLDYNLSKLSFIQNQYYVSNKTVTSVDLWDNSLSNTSGIYVVPSWIGPIPPYTLQQVKMKAKQITYQSTNQNVVDISTDGVLKILKQGTAKITVIFTKTDGTQLTASTQITVTNNGNIIPGNPPEKNKW